MAVITPQTEIRLVKCPLELSDLNQLTFSNVSAQYTYFNSLPHVTADNATYQRKDGYIRFPAEFDEIIQYNYVMYQNEAYSNKWFYAYITKMEYLSNGSTAVYIQTDTFQTWQFDLTYKQCFVEREHTMDDTVGSNLVPEDLETGEYVLNGTVTKVNPGHTMYVLNTTLEPYVHTRDIAVDAYGLPMAGGLYAFDNWQTMVNALSSYNDGQLEAIQQVYTVPSYAFDDDDLDMRYDPQHEDDEHMYYKFTGGNTPQSYENTLSRPSTINGYTPRNNKLLTAPFQNLVITNNNGSANTLAYEYFTNPTSFKIKRELVPTVGCSMLLYPENYKGIANNYNEMLMGGKYPTLSWSGDTFTNWLTQNAVNIGLGVVSNIATLGISGMSSMISKSNVVQKALMGASAGVTAADSIGDTVSQIYQHSLVPDTIKGNTNGGDVITSSNVNTFYVYPMSITSQFAQIADGYFDMYGYKTNRVKVPNVFGRTNWNFVKTIGCYIDGNIPQEDMQRIKEMFDAGVTFWHNPSTFMNYSSSNTIVV